MVRPAERVRGQILLWRMESEYRNKKYSQVWWHMSVIPPTCENHSLRLAQNKHKILSEKQTKKAKGLGVWLKW
jgi:hypothetical protein